MCVCVCVGVCVSVSECVCVGVSVCVCQVNGVQLYGKSRREAVAFLREVPPPFRLVCCRHQDLDQDLDDLDQDLDHQQPGAWRATPNVDEVERHTHSVTQSLSHSVTHSSLTLMLFVCVSVD